MDGFNFKLPTEFVFGKDTEYEVANLIKKYGGTRVLVHYGSKSCIKSGLLDRVKKTLDEANITYFLLGGVEPNPKSSLVNEGIALARCNNIDFILAVGGGSVIDSSKAIGMGALYDGDFWDIYSGIYYPTKTIPVGTILTIAAAGSEGSSSSVITNDKLGLKRGHTNEVIRPVFSILNPMLTTTLPAYQTACGITDIMAHAFERYLTNTKDVEISDRLIEAMLLTLINEAPKVMKDLTNYEARANIMWCGCVTHNDIIGMGRSQDWASHQIEHELSGLYDVAHGAGLAVVMPHYMEYVINHDPKRFQQMATRIFGVKETNDPLKDGLEGIKKLKEFLKSIGMPLTFEEINAKEEDIPYLVSKLGLNGKVRTGFTNLTDEDLTNIYKLCLK